MYVKICVIICLLPCLLYPPHPTTGYGYEERTGLQALMGLSTAAAYAASNQPQSLPRPQPRRVAPKGGVHRQFKASHQFV